MNWKSQHLQERQALEQRIDAIIDRYNGVPYAQVLERRRLTPNQFYIAATHKLHDLVEYASEEKREVLEKILADDEKYRELFRMGEEFIREQYLRVIGKLQPKQRRLPEGIFVNPENLELLTYCALTYHNPKLSSGKRAEVIQGVKELTADLAVYLHSIGLSGLMSHALNSSPLEVLKAFDRVYQRKAKDASLFDLSQPPHLHEWDFTFKAPRSYWQDLIRVEEAAYHDLTERNPQFASNNREEVIQAFQNLPERLRAYLRSIGFGGALECAFRGEKSPLTAFFKAFDKAFQRKTGNLSLFNQTQTQYLPIDSQNFLIR